MSGQKGTTAVSGGGILASLVKGRGTASAVEGFLLPWSKGGGPRQQWRDSCLPGQRAGSPTVWGKCPRERTKEDRVSGGGIFCLPCQREGDRVSGGEILASLVKGQVPPQCGENVRVSGQKGTAAVSSGGILLPCTAAKKNLKQHKSHLSKKTSHTFRYAIILMRENRRLALKYNRQKHYKICKA